MPKPPHYAPKAKRVIHLFMAGAPSQLDLFDYKPKLAEYEGKPIPPEVIGGQRYAFIRADAGGARPAIQIRPAWSVRGRAVGDVAAPGGRGRRHLPDQVGAHRPVQSRAGPDLFQHRLFAARPAEHRVVGDLRPWEPRPSDLPAFVVMSTGSGISGGAANWSSGFLPTIYYRRAFPQPGRPDSRREQPGGDRRPVAARLARPGRCAQPAASRRGAAIRRSPRGWPLTRWPIRLQTSAPELLDLKQETKETLDMYGVDPAKPSFARACLLARRMIERGVRFVNIYHEGWDAHSDVAGNLKNNCGQTDQALGGLDQGSQAARPAGRHAGHLGRRIRPHADGRNQPRAGPQAGPRPSPAGLHHVAGRRRHQAGHHLGATDELGFNIVDNPVHVHDLQATMLHLLGLDHERLTYTYRAASSA